MKIVLDIDERTKINENDIIVFKDGKWAVMSKESFLANYVNSQRTLNKKYEKRISKLENDLVALAKIVKEK